MFGVEPTDNISLPVLDPSLVGYVASRAKEEDKVLLVRVTQGVEAGDTKEVRAVMNPSCAFFELAPQAWEWEVDLSNFVAVFS